MIDYHLLYYYLFNESKECKMQKKNETRKMDKEIEEMMLTVPQKIVAYDGNPAGQHLYGEQRQEIAEALYNAGYRKPLENSVVLSREDYDNFKLELQKAHNKGVQAGFDMTKFKEQSIKNKASKETVKKFADKLKAENERLTERLKQVLLSIDTVKEMNAMCNIDEQRKQAVKEFAEKLKQKLKSSNISHRESVVIFYLIAELLKGYEK